MRYGIKESKVSHELIDGEVIIIHFESGNYYSLRESAARIWEGLAGGGRLEDIYARFAGLEQPQQDEIRGFLDQLVRENLIEEVEETGLVSVASGAVPAGEFSRPVFEKYQDMQELLLADPIHQVDEAGWPKAKN